jgi:hypothetical protein
VFNGIDALLNARFGAGGYVYGGVSTGRTAINNCATSDVPGQNPTALPFLGSSLSTPFCKVTIPWSGNTEFKLTAVYPLPRWGLQTSVAFQNVPGIPQLAQYVAMNAQIAPSLGRNLAACPAPTGPCNATVTINLFAPYTQFERRNNQVDFRFSKIFKLGMTRKIQGNFDVYNLTNEGEVTLTNTVYGRTWLTPQSIITGRLFKWSLQYNF